MFCQCPGDLGGVVTNGAGHQTQQLHRPGPLLVPDQCVNNISTIHVTCHTVPGNVELVNVGDWTQTPELEVHLVLVLAGAGDDVVGDAGPVLGRSCVAQRQLRYIEWKGVKIYDFQKITLSTLFKLHIAGLGVLIPKRYHMLG